MHIPKYQMIDKHNAHIKLLASKYDIYTPIFQLTIH